MTAHREKVVNYINSIVDDTMISTEIEESIYHYCVSQAFEKQIVQTLENKFFMILYKDRVRSITLNLKDKNNLLLEKIKNGTINTNSIGKITHQDMNAAIWKDIIQQKIERDNHIYDNNTEGTSKEFKCSRCKKRETQYTQVQTRSADEPMTTFVTCINCGNHWKC